MSRLTLKQLESLMKRLIRRMVLKNIEAQYLINTKRLDQAHIAKLESDLACTNAKTLNEEYKLRTGKSFDYRLE